MDVAKIKASGDAALAQISNALDDLEYSPDQRPVPLLRLAMDYVRDIIAELGQEVGAVADGELPGMWSASDFTGGDPDERSHAARNVDHSTSMESWFSAIDDTDELFTNAPDERFASRASRVMTYLKANRPTSPAHTSEARDAGGFDAWWASFKVSAESPEMLSDRDFAKAVWDAAMRQEAE